jgi:hypothetical protein
MPYPTQANTTLAAAIAAGFDGLSPRDVMLCILQGVLQGAVQFGNYGGTTPPNSAIPSSGNGLLLDTSTQNIWSYDNGAFHLIV